MAEFIAPKERFKYKELITDRKLEKKKKTAKTRVTQTCHRSPFPIE